MAKKNRRSSICVLLHGHAENYQIDKSMVLAMVDLLQMTLLRGTDWGFPDKDLGPSYNMLCFVQCHFLGAFYVKISNS